MTRLSKVVAMICRLLAMCVVPGNIAAAATISNADWAAYRSAFIEADGRVVDTANGRITHSEGQGYGMLLAFLAGNRGDFERIWAFTRTELMLRDDGLAMWRWDPASTPHITDPNNASDGDVLITYALGLAGKAWRRPDLTGAAASLAQTIGERLVKERNGSSILMPGAEGYDASARPDGPVVNLSYWIFEAFPLFSELAPGTDWAGLSASGVSLIGQSLTPPSNLPPEWLSLRTSPRAAKGFANEFGYNALRIPLYLIRGKVDAPALIEKLTRAMAPAGTDVLLVDRDDGSTVETLRDPGYRIIPALAKCVLNSEPLPADLGAFTPTLYYPSTLYLLAHAYLTEHEPGCLP